MYKRQYYLPIVPFICALSFCSNLQAAIEMDLDYALRMEQHTERDDRLLSDFIVTLDDQYVSSQFNVEADLTTNFVYEHRDEEDSTLLEGEVASEYLFNESFSWILESQFTEINEVSGQDLDELNSQTVSVVSTGLVFDYTRGLRGGIITRLLTKKVMYEESPLDADEQTFEISYFYPFNSSSSLTTSYIIERQEYDDTDESINDVETDLIRIDYRKQFSFVITELYFELNDIEYLNQDTDEEVEAYGISFSYQINSRSLVAIEYSHDLLQTFSLNTTLVDPQNPVLTSGLVENDRYAVHYNFLTNRVDFRFELYRNELDDVSDSGTSTGNQEGLIIEYTQYLTEKLDFGFSYEELENEIDGADTNFATVSLRYQISESANYSTFTSLNVEDWDEDSDQEDDVELLFEVRVSII